MTKVEYFGPITRFAILRIIIIKFNDKLTTNRF